MTEEVEQECMKQLGTGSFTPACEPSACSAILESDVYHENCRGMAMFTPVQVVGCFNSQTGEWRYAAPGVLIDECEKLRQQDPNWELANCYCCC